MTDDRLWRPDGADLWVDPRSDEPDRVHAPVDTALVDVSRSAGSGGDGGWPAGDARGEAVDDPSEVVTGGAPRRRRTVGALALLAGVAGLAVSTVAAVGDPSLDGSLREPTEVELFAGADPRRLPDSIEVDWTTDIPLDAGIGASMIAGDGRLVLTLPDPEPCLEPSGRCADLPDRRLERPRTALSVVDIGSGGPVWTAHVELDTSGVDVLGVVSDVVITELRADTGRVVVGFDGDDGVERWRVPRGGAESVEILPGTSILTRSTFGARPRLEFIDPSDGAVLDRIDGSLVATDHSGRWWARDRVGGVDSLTAIDLRGPGVEIGQPIDLALPDVDVLSVVDGDPLATVGGQFLVHDGADGWTAVDVRTPGPSIPDADREGGAAPWPLRLRLPASIIGVTPTSANEFAFTGGGSVYGATLVDGTDAADPTASPAIDVRWQLRGVITQAVPTDRGLLLIVANEGGAALRVVDGVSGEVLAEVQMFAGVLDSLRLVGNGFVTKRSAGFGVELAAVDLDGRDRWTLVGSDPFVVGDGVVVTRTTTDEGVRLTARRAPDG